MENKIYTVAILGVGARGGDVYGTLINEYKDKFKIVSLCDKKIERLERFKKVFNVDENNLFLDEVEFFKEKRADVLIIATLDLDHVRHMLKGLELGYDILAEKPVADKVKDCKALLDAQKKYGGKVLVCHVLRFAPAFIKTFELLESNKIGKLVHIDALERVTHWHQSHSYVRGNWRNTEVAMPMILAKCCHDLDLLQYYAKSKCSSISSIGDNTFFKEENAPEGSSSRCMDCKFKDTCVYSAKRIYIDGWHMYNKPVDSWPFNILAEAPVTLEKLYDAISNGQYGRCVFRCDNNVVDHEVTTMTFENGVKASLTMTAFTHMPGRRYVFHGTEGELILDESINEISIRRFLEPIETIDINALNDKGYGHGGGDQMLIDTLYQILNGNIENRTSLEASLESHLMGIYAEKSRLSGGKTLQIKKIN